MKVIKKTIANMLLAALIIVSPMSVLAESPSSWAVSQVNEAIGLNLVPDFLQSNYTHPITRAEFCALAVALYEAVNGEITGRITFADTNDVNVEKAAYVGIVSGVGDNRFAPHDRLTREQAAVMLARLAQSVGKQIPASSPNFADNNAISSWAVSSVGQVQAAGIMSGTGNNRFSPADPYTREQSIVTIMRAYDFVTGSGEVTITTPIVLNSLPISDSLRRGMTEAQFNEAYDIAHYIVTTLLSDFPGLSQTEQVEALFSVLAFMRHGTGEWEYSESAPHYSNVYGFFVLNRTSCAGDVRAAALALTILGIPHEHVNENQWAHQWIRLEVDGRYVVFDVNAPLLDYELEPYKHPWIG